MGHVEKLSAILIQNAWNVGEGLEWFQINGYFEHDIYFLDEVFFCFEFSLLQKNKVVFIWALSLIWRVNMLFPCYNQKENSVLMGKGVLNLSSEIDQIL